MTAATADGPKYPHVHVQLTGQDGNAMTIIGRVRIAIGRAGAPNSDLDEFTEEATSGDYQNLLAVVDRWVTTS